MIKHYFSQWLKPLIDLGHVWYTGLKFTLKLNFRLKFINYTNSCHKTLKSDSELLIPVANNHRLYKAAPPFNTTNLQVLSISLPL